MYDFIDEMFNEMIDGLIIREPKTRMEKWKPLRDAIEAENKAHRTTEDAFNKMMEDPIKELDKLLAELRPSKYECGDSSNV